MRDQELELFPSPGEAEVTWQSDFMAYREAGMVSTLLTVIDNRELT